MLTWKEAAKHFWHGRKLAREQEVRLKRRLWDERCKWARLVNTLSDILMDIAYDKDDVNHEACNVCCTILAEDGGHKDDCLYMLGLAVLVEYGASAEISRTRETFLDQRAMGG